MKSKHWRDQAIGAMRFYARHISALGSFRLSKAEAVNWRCCEKTLSEFTQRERDILIALYAYNDRFDANVAFESMTRNVPEKSIWMLNSRFLERFACNRGLK